MATLAQVSHHLVQQDGLAGVVVAMTLESAGVPLPSEVVMPLAGFVSGGVSGLVAVIAAGTVGNVLGSWIGYAVGAAVGSGWRGGRWLRRDHWEAAHRWFQRHGDRAVFIGRLLPVIRTYISFPAGAAGMPLGRFTLYTLLGSLPWSAALALAGYALGSHWQAVIPWFDRYSLITLALTAAVAAVWLARARRRPT